MDEIQHWMKEREKEYQKLNEHIQSVCVKNKLNTHLPIRLKDFMVEKTHKIAYCRNAKAGTSTWMQHFNNLQDPELRLDKEKKHNNAFHTIIPKRFSIVNQIGKGFNFQSVKKYFSDNEYLTFSFVRHPFDRIVSAYKDKAEEKSKDDELKIILEKIGQFTTLKGRYVLFPFWEFGPIMEFAHTFRQKPKY